MNAVEYIYKMFFRKKKCIVMCTLELQQTVFTLSFIVAHLLSFPPRREKDHLSRRDEAFLKSFQIKTCVNKV